MESVLRNLYDSNLGFTGEMHGPDSPFVKAARRKHDSLEKLVALLGEREKELFEQFCEAQGDIEDISRYRAFVQALKFGILFTEELFIDM